MLLAVLAYLVVYTASEVSAECPNCIRGTDGTCYTITYLFNLDADFRDRVVIKKMGILYRDNTLYYSYEPAIDDPEYYKIGYINLDHPENNGTLYDKNVSVHNFGTFDIDQESTELYLGGRDGIYKMSPSKQITWYSSRGDEILALFLKDYLYFVKDNEPTIMAKKNDSFVTILQGIKIKNFVITKDNVIVYLERYGLFLRKREEAVWLSKNPFFRGLAIDLDGTVYTWWIDEIYKIEIAKNITESRLVHVASIRHLVSMTFDTDNSILFNVGRSLNKMALSNYTEC